MSSSPRTSSFFDTSTAAGSPPPAPRWTPNKNVSTPSVPSPLSLSRASSQRHVPPPPIGIPTEPAGRLSPLHHSPSTLTDVSWRPPLPRALDDIDLRFSPSPTFLLGVGRYAHVYLASYRPRPKSSRKLCAAKRMAPDRESQTMGLREAFFLNRLAATSRPLSPVGSSRPTTGGVYIIKLIAVKEDIDHRRGMSHTRSTSDAFDGQRSRLLTRQRSSTFGVRYEPSSMSNGTTSRQTLASTSQLLILLEHAPLGTVDRLIRASPDLIGRAMWEKWARQCMEALAWVHEKGIVHADIKPGNLLLTQDLNIRLSDFGSSLLINNAHPPKDGVGLGTLPFSAPELVDPARSFSFPIDVFALGATLYQCISGREPYRGCRSVEMMYHVRQGDLWEWEERVRLGRIGDDAGLHGSHYPTAWLDDASDGVRRGGSLRIPTSKTRRPLVRMPSAESLRASEDVAQQSESSPSGVKLWASWVKSLGAVAPEPIAALLDDGAEIPQMSYDAPDGSIFPSSDVPTADPNMPYLDGSPKMIFLDGQNAVTEEWRDVLRRMIEPNPSGRPTADELRGLCTSSNIGHYNL